MGIAANRYVLSLWRAIWLRMKSTNIFRRGLHSTLDWGDKHRNAILVGTVVALITVLLEATLGLLRKSISYGYALLAKSLPLLGAEVKVEIWMLLTCAGIPLAVSIVWCWQLGKKLKKLEKKVKYIEEEYQPGDELSERRRITANALKMMREPLYERLPFNSPH